MGNRPGRWFHWLPLAVVIGLVALASPRLSWAKDGGGKGGDGGDGGHGVPEPEFFTLLAVGVVPLGMQLRRRLRVARK